MALHSIREGWLIAVDQLRANKLRSGLTILGVVIGIATVMAMASIVAGFREQIVNTLEVVGPTTFRILRFFSSTPLNPDALPREVRIRPALAPEEAEAIARLPVIRSGKSSASAGDRFGSWGCGSDPPTSSRCRAPRRSRESCRSRRHASGSRSTR